MNLNIYPTPQVLAAAVADLLISVIRKKKDAVICLASGDSPRETYRVFCERVKSENIDISEVSFVGLDEWVGVPPENPGSCRYFLEENVFKPLEIPEKQVFFFNPMNSDLDGECRKMNDHIHSRGGLDVMLVGVGLNGHVGLNEPGTPSHLYAHYTELDPMTVQVGQKYFKEHTPVTRGITLGLNHFMEARTAVMIAQGSKKAEIMKTALEGEITTRVPASIIHTHQNGFVFLDREAASLLQH